jgi:hypothetical protein
MHSIVQIARRYESIFSVEMVAFGEFENEIYVGEEELLNEGTLQRWYNRVPGVKQGIDRKMEIDKGCSAGKSRYVFRRHQSHVTTKPPKTLATPVERNAETP